MLFFLAKNELAKMAGFDRVPYTDEERTHIEIDPDCACLRCQRRRFMAQLKPVKFGNGINFSATAATYTLAAVDVPHDVQLLIFRVETTMSNYTSGAPDFGVIEKVPSLSSGGLPLTAWWQIGPYGSSASTAAALTEDITNKNAQTQLALDTDDFIAVPSGYNVHLIGSLVAIGDGYSRNLQCTVYAFFCTPFVMSLIQGQVCLIAPGL